MVPPNSKPKLQRTSIGVCLDSDEGFGRRILYGFEDFRRHKRLQDWRLVGNYRAGLSVPIADLHLYEVDAFVGHFNEIWRVRKFEEQGIPIVGIQTWEWDQAQSPRLLIDEKAIGRMAARHLRAQGYERFAFYGNSSAPWAKLKLEGFQEELSGLGGYEVSNSIYHDYAELGWREFGDLKKWCKQLQVGTAVFCWNDFYANLLCEVCRELDYRIPHDIALMGVNDDPFCSAIAGVQITSIDLGPRNLGRRAGELLAKRIEGTLPDHYTEISQPVRIIPRESTLRDTGATQEVLAALDYLQENFRHEIRIPEVAKAAGASSRTLNRHFSQILGSTPSEELTRIRIEHAKRLLSREDLSLSEVSQMVGYTEERTLTTHFKNDRGITPARYRKEMKRSGPTSPESA